MPHWVKVVNELMSVKEHEAFQTCVAGMSPYGSEAWQMAAAGRPGVMQTMRPEGRPKKVDKAEK